MSESKTMVKEDKEKDQQKQETGFGSTSTMLLGAAAGLAAWGLSRLVSSGSSDNDDKMMKAPGRDSQIRRKEFEDNPSKYFRDLRRKD
ncbi:hypothetical protein ACHQM5_011240 [Ranunculus cassubicifolius]